MTDDFNHSRARPPAVVTGFTVEWAQRQCELWAVARDRNL